MIAAGREKHAKVDRPMPLAEMRTESWPNKVASSALQFAQTDPPASSPVHSEFGRRLVGAVGCMAVYGHVGRHDWGVIHGRRGL
jgi:hypothetical protein